MKTGWIDFFGKPIIIGSKIVYPVRVKSAMYLKEATVTAVEDESIIAYDTNNRRVRLRNPTYIVVMSNA